MWKYLKSYKFHSILIRNFIFIFLICSIPTALVTVTVQNKYNHAVVEEIKTANYNSALRTTEIVDRILKDSTLMATHLSISPVHNLYFVSDQSFVDYYNIEDSIIKRTAEVLSMYDYMHTVFYEPENLGGLFGSILETTSMVGLSNTSLTDENWYEKDKEDSDTINRYFGWREARYGRVPNDYIAVVHYVRKGRDQFLGSVTINLKVDTVATMAGIRYNPEDRLSVAVVDNSTGKVILSRQGGDFLKNIEDISIFSMVDLQAPIPSEIQTINEEKYIMTTIQSTYTDLTYLFAQPLTGYSNDVHSIYSYVKKVLILFVIMSLLMSFLLAMKTYEPVGTIMKIIENGKLKDRDNSSKTGANEVSFISDNIFKIITSHRGLEQELRQKMNLLDKAQNKALQAQMSPHFLHNTLEAINWTAIEMANGQNEISQMVTYLSEVLDYSLDGEQFATFSDEVSFCKVYIELMKKRYKNRLDVFWDIPESVESCHIIKLFLQPILENAIYHGIKPKRMSGEIYIKAEVLSGNTLRVVVFDNGVGMSPDTLQALKEKITSEYLLQKEGIGLYNVNQRIKILYGHDYGIDISSTEQIGTSVVVTIPYLQIDPS